MSTKKFKRDPRKSDRFRESIPKNNSPGYNALSFESMYQDVRSSRIKYAGWQFSNKYNMGVMRVFFQNMRCYEVFPVDFKVFQRFLTSDSPGRFYSSEFEHNPLYTKEEVDYIRKPKSN